MSGRIPQGFIDDLLERVDIVEIIDARSSLKKAGRNYKGLCPFHDEKTPSFSVNADKQFYHCFGCGAGGNAVSFMMDYERLDFPQAIDALAATVGLEVPKEDNPSFNKVANNANKALYEILERCAELFHSNLRGHPGGKQAIEYLKNRGLDGNTAKQFEIGYAPPGWDNLIKAVGTTPLKIKQLFDSGMLIEKDNGDYYDRFRDRIMFPIRDHRGRVVGFGGRVLGDDKPKYLNSPETPVFSKSKELYGLYEARKSKGAIERIVVVEGYMDVVALAQSGIHYATATLGTATSSDHLERIFRVCPEVVFCFDGDKAGRAAANRALENVLPMIRDGLQARFLFLPDGEDPDTLVRSIGADRFEHQIGQGLPLSQYLFDHVSEGLDVQSMDGRARLSTLAIPMIDQIPEGVFKSLMHKELATRTGLEADTLEQLRQQGREQQQAKAQLKQQQDQLANQRYQQSKQAAKPADDGYDGYFNNDDGGHHEAPPVDIDHDDNNGAPAPRRPQAKQRPSKSPAINSRQRSNIQTAITLLLYFPGSISQLDNTEAIDDLQDQDALLLKEIIAFLKNHPATPTYTLIGHWIGTSFYERLQELLNDDMLLSCEDGAQQQLIDIFSFLANQQQQGQLEQELNTLSEIPFNEMSAEQKLRYSELLISHSKH
ncbi:DNA primase [Sinobacterium norvegicum]|uniref:DNA primase n=1 Tax=Sinobacterium norvegicum TaxID=1641715 RepID=A0ABN8EI56_9GAMM|nr:DNA primase [Sinobacterium norvegicum]CAH0992106.1 DNA primase [Sinobacterium norvegicum]